MYFLLRSRSLHYRAARDGTFTETYPDDFQKVRMPWWVIRRNWTNLNIEWMPFETYCNGEKGDLGEGCYEYNKCLHKEGKEMWQGQRHRKVEEAEEAGMI